MAFRNEHLAADIDLLKTAVALFRILCERPGEANFADLKTINVLMQRNVLEVRKRTLCAPCIDRMP